MKKMVGVLALLVAFATLANAGEKIIAKGDALVNGKRTAFVAVERDGQVALRFGEQLDPFYLQAIPVVENGGFWRYVYEEKLLVTPFSAGEVRDTEDFDRVVVFRLKRAPFLWKGIILRKLDGPAISMR